MTAKELATLLSFAAPYRQALMIGGVLMLLESAAALAVPWLAGSLTEMMLQGGATAQLAIPAVLGAMLALFSAQALLKFANELLLGGTAEKIGADLKVRVYDHLQALPLSFFHQRRHGDTLALLTRDVQLVSEYIGGSALGVVPLLFTVSGAVFLMFRLQPVLAMLAAFLIPLFFLLLKILGRRFGPLAAQIEAEHVTAISIADQNLGMLPAIKLFTREPQESARYRRQIEQILRLTTRQIRIQAAFGPASQFIAAAGIILVLWLASGQIGRGELSAPELVSFLLYAQLLTRPVAGLANIYGHTRRAGAAMRRLLHALDEKPEPHFHTGMILPPVKGEVAFEGVTFAYQGRPAALQGVALHVNAGETVAIVGPNGAGKSTLSHLLTRLHEPTGGRITIDGIDIAAVSLQSLRGQIGVVPQHVLLFNGTIHDNIAYGRPTPMLAEIEVAARAARAHEFIVQLPQGYDTMIGDGGVRLSGGQRQRVALARALLKDPPILILDEATAMFDPEGEREFLEACRDVLKKRTVLLITHRSAPLAIADRTLRMDNGKLASEGDAVTSYWRQAAGMFWSYVV